MSAQSQPIPLSLQPYFQEYDLTDLHLRKDANLIIQRTLEYGTWEEVRWLFQTYTRQRIQRFLREHGERWPKPVTFNYWRKLLGVRRWQSAPFGKGEVWIPFLEQSPLGSVNARNGGCFSSGCSPAFYQKFLSGRWPGLALHLGHRFSVDLDLFSTDETAVGPDQRDAMRMLLGDPSLSITHDIDGTFVATWQDVGISFFRLPLYPLVQSPMLLDGIPLATLPEIGAMKLAAIIDRGTRKDMVDLY